MAGMSEDSKPVTEQDQMAHRDSRRISESRDEIDIHGVDWSKIPQVSAIECAGMSPPYGITVWMNGPVTNEQLESFREHLRSWHP